MATAEEIFLAKKKAKKANRRGAAEEQATLSITSLMDVVSIIVVYLLKSYGSDPVVIMPTAGQKIPMSLADTAILDGVPVYVSTRAITFANKKIVQLDENGEVDSAALTDTHLIGPLYDVMAEEAARGKEMTKAQGKPEEEWPAAVILVGDQNLKFSTLVKVMYTAGKAEYREYFFCVVQKNG